MTNCKSFCISVLALVLTSTLSACATFRGHESDSCSRDAKIKTTIQRLLDSSPNLGPPNSIHVQSIGRVVYLYGLVDTGPEKWIAESIALRTPGVVRVVNSIEQNN